MDFITEAYDMLGTATVRFLGEPLLALIFAVAVLIILVFEENKIKKCVVVGFPILVCIAIYNPITYWLCKRVFNGMVEYYCRIFSLIQVQLLIAYAIFISVKRINPKRRCLIIIVLSIVIISFGYNVYEETWITKADNSVKLSNDVIEICNIISIDDGMHKIAFPVDIATYIRQYDASIIMPYGRWGDTDEKEQFKNEINKENPDIEYLISAAVQNECEYIVVKRNNINKEALLNENQGIIGETNNYIIAQIKNVERTIKIYDNQGHIIKTCHYNDNNELSNNEYGYAFSVPKYNNLNQIVEWRYYGVNNNLITRKEGYAIIRYEYDYKGRKVKTMYYDTEEKLCNKNGEYAIAEFYYDEENYSHLKAVYSISGEKLY